MPNHLVDELSPYLLQHVNNPVDWHPWGEEALKKAQKGNKPIFLSIGYAACHWCHVMAHESFEDGETAAFMNEHFVNIKVDREERPDLDAIYMQATVAMTGSGGWPMSVFLTPDLKPFYAGTYFPPAPRYNMPSFRDILAGISRTWHEKPNEIFKVGEEVSSHLQQALTANIQSDSMFTQAHLESAEKSLIDLYDWGYGGWGSAPKFPQPMVIEYLLRRHSAGSDEALKPVVHALKAMARGGVYDVVGGGFSRYSVDNFWRVPHFEKMLYDNAQLVHTYLHAWQVTGESFFRQIVTETLDFIAREMTHPDGGFFSSLDADSEGEEGRFYVWTREELRSILGEDSDFFEAAYGVTPRGNWEGHTILQRSLDDASLGARFKLDPETVRAKLAECHSRLLSVRSARVRPGTDDKVLTSWNGLMLAALAEASRVLDPDVLLPMRGQQQSEQMQNRYYKMAVSNAKFLLKELRPNGKLKHSWRDGRTTSEVFLEDYGAMILGLLELYQTDFDTEWFASAKILADEMVELFEDPKGGFFDTSRGGENLLLRPKDIQDNATPSGNALACEALIKLVEFTGEGKYRELAEKALRLVVGMAARHPTAFGRWLSAAAMASVNVKQIAIMHEADGEDATGFVRIVRSQFRPHVILAASPYPPPDEAPAFLKNRPLMNGRPTAYVCEGFVCKNPVTTITEFAGLL